MREPETLSKRWAGDDSQRDGVLDRARLCASLTKPWILPPSSQGKNEKLPENYQSLGARIVNNLEGRMLLALYPPSVPWFQLSLSPKIRYDPRMPPEALQQAEQLLFVRELTLLSLLEAGALTHPHSGRRTPNFRKQKRQVISHILVTGDCLEQLTDDYRLKVFRRDQYVTSRDSRGDVLYHIIKERIDPLTLSQVELMKCDLKTEELMDMPVDKRMRDLYTLAEFQPLSRNWLIRQELKDKVIAESQEAVTPFISTPYELVSGEDYGRGFVEANLGDFRSLDELRDKLLDFAAMASKQHPIIDEASLMREEDFNKPSGTALRGRVRDGRVQDLAFMSVDKISDFNVVFQTADAIRKDLGKAGLMEEEVTPRGDRVTAFQVQRVAMELEGALGGVYAPLADDQQMPLLQRVTFQAQRDNLLAAMPEEVIEVKALTGIAALGRELDKQRLLSFVQVVSQLGEAATQRIDMAVLSDILRRLESIQEPGLIKTDEQLAQEQQSAMQIQAQQEAVSRGAEVIGDVAKQGAASQLALVS